ncbi:hypothetical protein [Kitasatospora griseola]|uniref:hypothetical protein n=1 Tax=Kitasatospora griseola TaxID=2064 RepID=UPI00343E1E12
MKLDDLRPGTLRRLGGLDLTRFCADPLVASLNWPKDVVEQFLYDHGDNAAFHADYGHLDLQGITWTLERTSTGELLRVPTGASDEGCIELYAEHPDHWVAVRSTGAHQDVARFWEEQGTWKRPPILIDRRLLAPAQTGLQVVEGRTRVGVLRGRHRQGAHVAPEHLTWVGRPCS